MDAGGVDDDDVDDGDVDDGVVDDDDMEDNDARVEGSGAGPDVIVIMEVGAGETVAASTELTDPSTRTLRMLFMVMGWESGSRLSVVITRSLSNGQRETEECFEEAIYYIFQTTKCWTRHTSVSPHYSQHQLLNCAT